MFSIGILQHRNVVNCFVAIVAVVIVHQVYHVIFCVWHVQCAYHCFCHYALVYRSIDSLDAVIQELGSVPASIDDRSHVMDQSVTGATVATVGTSSCGCSDQTGVVGGVLGADQIEQMINDKLTPLMAKNIKTMDGKLATLHADLRTQQLAMAELTNKQQTSDAERQLADRSADVDKYAELVRNFIFLLCLLLFRIHNLWWCH